VERIGVRELRQHASRYLDLVKAGQTVAVTERGKLVALLVPPTPEQSIRDRLIAEGRLIPAKRPFVLPEPVAVDGPDSATILDELREERL
jgi:prevent-host-death family protein